MNPDGQYYDLEHTVAELKKFTEPYLFTHEEMFKKDNLFKDGKIQVNNFAKLAYDFFKYYVPSNEFSRRQITDVSIPRYNSKSYSENGDSDIRRFTGTDFIDQLSRSDFFEESDINFHNLLCDCKYDKLLPKSIVKHLKKSYTDYLEEHGVTNRREGKKGPKTLTGFEGQTYYDTGFFINDLIEKQRNGTPAYMVTQGYMFSKDYLFKGDKLNLTALSNLVNGFFKNYVHVSHFEGEDKKDIPAVNSAKYVSQGDVYLRTQHAGSIIEELVKIGYFDSFKNPALRFRNIINKMVSSKLVKESHARELKSWIGGYLQDPLFDNEELNYEDKENFLSNDDPQF